MLVSNLQLSPIGSPPEAPQCLCDQFKRRRGAVGGSRCKEGHFQDHSAGWCTQVQRRWSHQPFDFLEESLAGTLGSVGGAEEAVGARLPRIGKLQKGNESRRCCRAGIRLGMAGL